MILLDTQKWDQFIKKCLVSMEQKNMCIAATTTPRVRMDV